MSQSHPKPKIPAGVAVFALSILFFAGSMDLSLNMFDEGIVLSDAMRVLAGDRPHRDFYSSYGPGAYYIVAALFELTPARFIIARSYGVVVLAAVVTLVSLALIGRVRNWVRLGCVATCALLLAYSKAYLYPLFPCLLLAICSSLLLVQPTASYGSTRLFLVGVCAGVAAYFRYDTALVQLALNIAAIALLLVREAPRSSLASEVARAILFCSLGAAAVFLPGLLAYVYTSPISGFYDDIVAYGLRYYAEMRGLPFPGWVDIRKSPEKAYVYLPVVAVVCVVAELWHRRALPRNADDRAGFSFLVVFGLLSAGMFYKGIVRVSTLHMLMSIVPALMVIAFCINAWWSRSIGVNAAAIAVSVMAVMPALFEAPLQVADYRGDKTRMVAGWLFDRAGLTGSREDTSRSCPQEIGVWPARETLAYAAVSNYLRANTAPDEKILIGLDRHDRVFANPLSLYFTTRRLPATHWHQFDPGVQTRADIQAAMVAELSSQNTRWVVRDASYAGTNEPNGSSKSSGAFVLDDYLERNFRKVASSGKVSIWLANTSLPPAPNAVDGRCMPETIALPPLKTNEGK